MSFWCPSNSKQASSKRKLTTRHSVDGCEIHFAPPKIPWNDSIPQRKYQQTKLFQPCFLGGARSGFRNHPQYTVSICMPLTSGPRPNRGASRSTGFHPQFPSPAPQTPFFPDIGLVATEDQTGLLATGRDSRFWARRTWASLEFAQPGRKKGRPFLV